MKNMHQEYRRYSPKKLVVKYSKCFIFIGFDFLNSELYSHERSVLAAEIDVPLSQGNTYRLNYSQRGSQGLMGEV